MVPRQLVRPDCYKLEVPHTPLCSFPSSMDHELTYRSLHGKCNTIEESQAWFREHCSKYDTITYIVFAKKDDSGNDLEYPGQVVGNVGLRTQADGPALPPFSNTNSTAAPTSDQTPTNPNTPPLSDLPVSKPLNLRSLGYSYLPTVWGKGYATEAGKAVIEAYREGTKEERAKGEEVYYVEAIWGDGNPASGKVLGKLGFQTIGYKEEEKAFLAGAWRYGYYVSGLYV